jgi:MFS family permease
MQRIAQDWVVLTELTAQNATALGIVMALQFGPQILLLPLTGYVADHFDKRKTVLVTQAAMALQALGLGLLILTGLVELWHVYVFALLLGCASAFDAPVRHGFVSELVDDTHLSNAVALNSSSFHAGRLIGPAIAGLLIAATGSGWVFLINAASFVAIIAVLQRLRLDQLKVRKKAVHRRGSFAEGIRYVRQRPDLRALLLMLFLFGTFGANFPIYIATMAVTVFGSGASQFGFLTSMVAIGSVLGGLLSAWRDRPRIRFLLLGVLVFGVGLGMAAMMPSYGLFGMMLVFVGIAAQTFTTTAFSAAQLWTDADMRGRVVAIVLAISMGGTPIGAPLIGWVADAFGARWAMGVGAVSGIAAAMVGLRYLIKHRNLRLYKEEGRLRFSVDS